MHGGVGAAKPRKKSPKTAKPQEISSKTEIKALVPR